MPEAMRRRRQVLGASRRSRSGRPVCGSVLRPAPGAGQRSQEDAIFGILRCHHLKQLRRTVRSALLCGTGRCTTKFETSENTADRKKVNGARRNNLHKGPSG